MQSNLHSDSLAQVGPDFEAAAADAAAGVATLGTRGALRSESTTEEADFAGESPIDRIQELRLREMGVREQIVALVIEINRRRLYKREKFGSLRTYLIKELGYDYNEARQIAVAAGLILTGEKMTSPDPQVRARIEALRQWRTQKARIERVPAYLILTNRVLLALANANPLSLEAMAAVRGLGQGRIDRLGNEILGVLRFTPHASLETSSVSKSQAPSSSVSVVQ